MNISIDHPTGRPNFTIVEINGQDLYFSYKTLIAVRDGSGLLIRKNDWNQTTGKHLNFIDSDKSIRIDGEKFMKAVEKMGITGLETVT